MIRTYSFKAYLSAEDEAVVLDAMSRMRSAYNEMKEAGNLKAVTANLKTKLVDLWWPNRVLVREWAWKSPPDNKKKKKRRSTPVFSPEGMIAGALAPRDQEWAEMFAISRTVKLVERMDIAPRDGKAFWQLTMPVSEHQNINVLFEMHRVIPKEAICLRWHVVSKYSNRFKNMEALTWRIQFTLKLPDPKPRPTERHGNLDIHWYGLPGPRHGLISVATLHLKDNEGVERDIEYFVPNTFLKKGLQARSSGTPAREKTRFIRWRLDVYRKLAVQICDAADVINIMDFNVLKLRDLGAFRRERMVLALSILRQAVVTRATAVGATACVIK